MRSTAITSGDDDTIDVIGTGTGVVDDHGNFGFAIGGDGKAQSPVNLSVSTPEGVQVYASEPTLEQASKPLTLRVKGLPPLEISSSGDPTQVTVAPPGSAQAPSVARNPAALATLIPNRELSWNR